MIDDIQAKRSRPAFGRLRQNGRETRLLQADELACQPGSPANRPFDDKRQPAHDRIGRRETHLRSGGMFGFSRIISAQNWLCPEK
jgi:hypothetical protein